MDTLLWFFRDFLDGPIYYVVTFVAVIVILLILKYLLDEQKKNKEEQKIIDNAPKGVSTSVGSGIYIRTTPKQEEEKPAVLDLTSSKQASSSETDIYVSDDGIIDVSKPNGGNLVLDLSSTPNNATALQDSSIGVLNLTSEKKEVQETLDEIDKI